MNRRVILLAAISFGCGTLVLPSQANKESKAGPSGEKVYQQYCASCHVGGGNTVKPNKQVAGSKELVTLANFKNYLCAPPGHMPYYQQLVNDPQALKSLYDYCKALPKGPQKTAFSPVSK